MNILRRLSDGLVLYSNFGDYTLTDRFKTANTTALDIKSETHEVVQANKPENFYNNAYNYNDGVWTVGNQTTLDDKLNERKAKKISDIDKNLNPSFSYA